ncbi:hypothetical protein [Sandarakinorhabdus sp.]
MTVVVQRRQTMGVRPALTEIAHLNQRRRCSLSSAVINDVPTDPTI